MNIDQITFADDSQEYKDFIEKFKPKKTTDDCYTPELVYDAVLNYAINRYGLDCNNIVRPFWPGGDYQKADYPDGCCVVDNPPFSIISPISRWYMEHGIKFFLFAPHLTNFNVRVDGVTHIITAARVTYANGALVNTSFLTNLEPGILARSDAELRQIIIKADCANKAISAKQKQQPKYIYPNHILTASSLGYMATHGVEFVVKADDAAFTSAMDSQRSNKKGIFGGGYYLSEKAAAEKAAAEKIDAIRWPISEREWNIIKSLGHN